MIDVVIQEPKNAIALRFQIRSTVLVIGNVAIIRMSGAVNLNDEGRFATEKVDSEWTNRVLADEFMVLQASATQA